MAFTNTIQAFFHLRTLEKKYNGMYIHDIVLMIFIVEISVKTTKMCGNYTCYKQMVMYYM